MLRLFTIVALLMLLGSLAACGGDGDATDTRSGSRNVAAMATTDDDDQKRIHDRDYAHLMKCLPEGAPMQVVVRTGAIEGDTATVVQTLEIATADGQISTVERMLTFELSDDGRWVL